MRILTTCIFLLATHAQAYDLQAAIDADPGGTIIVPADTCTISEPIRITDDGTTIIGPLTVVQTNPEQLVVHIEDAEDVRIEGLTITRAEDQQVAEAGGIRISDSEGVVLERVKVLDCKAREAAIAIEGSERCAVRHCTVRNYKRIAVDDRTGDELYGYAFFAIDGTGIKVEDSEEITISFNQVVEEDLLPTREVKEEHNLGFLTEGSEETDPGELGESAVAAGQVSNWHQGSAILITGPESTQGVMVMNNLIENAAQGIDLHCDDTRVTGNVIDHCMVGLKATHGCEDLFLMNNVIYRADLWGILLNPGAASSEDNPDRNIRVMGNTILAYGYGHEYWNWGGKAPGAPGSYAIALYDGQLPENPPLRDVVIQNNVIAGNEVWPRYQYAVFVGSWHGPAEDSPNMPEALSFSDNQFEPGLEGVANVAL